MTDTLMRGLNCVTPEDPDYFDKHEVDRNAGTVNGSFMPLDGHGPLITGIEIARQSGSLAVLDAGCGSGNSLIDLKDQIEFRAPIEPERIIAVGIDRHDYTAYIPNPEGRRRAMNGYVNLRRGDLATIDLEPEAFDLAYAHEVLIHCEGIASIVARILGSLKSGGTFYCNTLPEQAIEFESLSRRLRQAGWTACSREMTRASIIGPQTRAIHKVVKPTAEPNQ
jgi:SAM-dependent methyltransferase